MSNPACPFCAINTEKVFYDGSLVRGFWDAFPVSPGHALLVPRRHVATWFDSSLDEQTELLSAIRVAREEIEKTHQPDGYNIGINIGEAGGQTVYHMHVHLIPRYAGDVPNPKGGVRHVIPGKANYVASSNTDILRTLPHERALVSGSDDPLLPHILAMLDTAIAADIVVAFVMESGVRQIFEHLRDFLDRGGRLRFLTGDYLDVTDPQALNHLLDLPGSKEMRVFESGDSSFHPKTYIFVGQDGNGYCICGQF